MKIMGGKSSLLVLLGCWMKHILYYGMHVRFGRNLIIFIELIYHIINVIRYLVNSCKLYACFIGNTRLSIYAAFGRLLAAVAISVMLKKS